MKNSSSIRVPIFASKKSRWKVIITSPDESDTSISKNMETASKSAVADFKVILFPIYSISYTTFSISVEIVSANTADGIIIATISVVTYAIFSFKSKLCL